MNQLYSLLLLLTFCTIQNSANIIIPESNLYPDTNYNITFNKIDFQEQYIILTHKDDFSPLGLSITHFENGSNVLNTKLETPYYNWDIPHILNKYMLDNHQFKLLVSSTPNPYSNTLLSEKKHFIYSDYFNIKSNMNISYINTFYPGTNQTLQINGFNKYNCYLNYQNNDLFLFTSDKDIITINHNLLLVDNIEYYDLKLKCVEQSTNIERISNIFNIPYIEIINPNLNYYEDIQSMNIIWNNNNFNDNNLISIYYEDTYFKMNKNSFNNTNNYIYNLDHITNPTNITINIESVNYNISKQTTFFYKPLTTTTTTQTSLTTTTQTSLTTTDTQTSSTATQTSSTATQSSLTITDSQTSSTDTQTSSTTTQTSSTATQSSLTITDSQTSSTDTQTSLTTTDTQTSLTTTDTQTSLTTTDTQTSTETSLTATQTYVTDTDTHTSTETSLTDTRTSTETPLTDTHTSTTVSQIIFGNNTNNTNIFKVNDSVFYVDILNSQTSQNKKFSNLYILIILLIFILLIILFLYYYNKEQNKENKINPYPNSTLTNYNNESFNSYNETNENIYSEAPTINQINQTNQQVTPKLSNINVNQNTYNTTNSSNNRLHNNNLYEHTQLADSNSNPSRTMNNNTYGFVAITHSSELRTPQINDNLNDTSSSDSFDTDYFEGSQNSSFTN